MIPRHMGTTHPRQPHDPRPHRLRLAIDRIEAVPVPHTVVAAVLMATLVAIADYSTGRELSFSIFYVAPVILIAWRLGRTAGLTMSVIAAIVWMLTDRWSGNRYSQPLIPVWNGLVRLGFFAIIASLAAGSRALLRQLAVDADHDELTGLLNRRGFTDRAATEVDRCRRQGTPLTLAFIDLDHFKRINDDSGHAAGDAVLVRVAETARSTLRGIDVIGRIGGDEFAVLLPGTTPDCARLVLDRFRRDLDADGRIGFSVGVVAFGDPPMSVEDALARADVEMYRAKTTRR